MFTRRLAIAGAVLALCVLTVWPTQAPAATATLSLLNRASGVQWAVDYSSPNNENDLEAGADYADFGVGNGNTSTQLRFDASSLYGMYTQINSATIRLTQQVSLPARQGGTLEAYSLAPANAGWNSNGTYRTQDGTTAWAGGTHGALVSGTDYLPALLAGAPYLNSNPASTVYSLTVPSAQAKPLIDQWVAGSNTGVLIRANGPGAGQDNRVLFNTNPQMVVDYTPTDRLTFTPTNRASGAQWAPGYSNPNQQSDLEIGADYADFGTGNGNTSTQLRFDVSGLNGRYSQIYSAHLLLTQQVSFGGRAGGTIQAYQLTAANTAWNNNGTYATRDGSIAWAGGANGALVAGTDYAPALLGSVAYVNANPVGTTYDVVIPAAQAAALITQWNSGQNTGLLLRGSAPAAGQDNRASFYTNPQLIVTYAALPSMTFAAQNRASGAQWAPAYSNPNQQGDLEVGADYRDFGAGNGNTSTELRFNVTPFAHQGDVQAVIIHLTQKGSFANRGGGTLQAFLLTAADAAWTNNGTYGTLNGSTPWAGGANGALIAGTDYLPTLLGTVPYQCSNPDGTVYDLVIPGSRAQSFLNDWATGGLNTGFLLRADGVSGGDNRISFNIDPELIVTYTVPEPITLALLGLGAAGLAGYVRRRTR